MEKLRLVFTCLIIGLITPSLTLAEKYREISWDDLMPEDWIPEPPPEMMHDGFGEFNQLPAPIVPKMNNQMVKIPGYVLPTKYDEKGVSEFLLVPFLGACIHVPPPPENQMVLVRLSEIYESDVLYEPVWVTGQIKTENVSTEYASAGYVMEKAIAVKYQ